MKQTITRYELEILESLIAARKAIIDATARLMLADSDNDIFRLGAICGAVNNGGHLRHVLRQHHVAVEDPLVDESTQGGE